MKNELGMAIQLCREPMIAARSGKVTHFNPPAKKLFSGLETGRSVYDFIPDHILNISTQGCYTSSIESDAGRLTFTVIRDNDSALLHFADDRERFAANFLSDSLINSLLTSLFSAGLAIERLSELVPPSESSAHYISILYHSYYSLLHLICNINLAMQLSDGTLGLTLRRADVALLCSDLVSTVALLMKHKDVELSFSTELGKLYAVIDVEKTQRVILNLLQNSYQHTPPGGRISVTLEERDGKALITVKDTGSGMTPEVLRNVFRSYSNRIRLETLSSEPRPGLGLAISRGIAELHSGALIVDSAHAQGGATIYLSLPLEPPSNVSFSATDGEKPAPNMQLILSELSDILDYSFYSSAYLD